MARECPFCRQSDLADDALKCHHCGSWLDERKSVDEFEAFRREMLTVVSSDLEKHRASTEKILTRMQVFAVVIAGVAGAFAYYFTGVTKENITQTSSRITEAAEREVAAAADQAKTEAIARVDRAVAQQMNTPETSALIADQIAASVRDRVDAEVAEQLEGVEEDVEGRVSATLAAKVDEMQAGAERRVETVVEDLSARFEAEASARLESAASEIEARVAEVRALAAAQSAEASTRLEAVGADIDALRRRTEAALASVDELERPYRDAQDLKVATIDSVLAFQAVEASGKRGPGLIPELMERRINALTYVAGEPYDGPISWKYFDRLTTLPEFRHAILVDRDGETALGYWDARELARALNPPFNDEMTSELGPDPFALPDADDVPGWVEFAEALGAADIAALESLPGYRPVSEAVEADMGNFEALALLERLGADRLPVLDDAGRLVGFVDRSRLTTRMLLEVADR